MRLVAFSFLLERPNSFLSNIQGMQYCKPIQTYDYTRGIEYTHLHNRSSKTRRCLYAVLLSTLDGHTHGNGFGQLGMEQLSLHLFDLPGHTQRSHRGAFSTICAAKRPLELQQLSKQSSTAGSQLLQHQLAPMQHLDAQTTLDLGIPLNPARSSALKASIVGSRRATHSTTATIDPTTATTFHMRDRDTQYYKPKLIVRSTVR
jgi:hypothetical protein